ncbi:MAG TPA: hypothetical protein VMU15_13275 [Anaeromyxobacter sp.]|nr:hypothetical protein [Anaeromyxobacter sp.]
MSLAPGRRPHPVGRSAAAALLLALPAAARPEDPSALESARTIPHYEYLEDSYLDYFLPNTGPAHDDRLLYDAQAAAHLFLVNTWNRVERPSPAGRPLHVLSWDVSFLIRLRMIQEQSKPVRPPSYMPTVRGQWFVLWRLGPGEVRELETELAVTHHSNGQQGCSWAVGHDPTRCLPAYGGPDTVNYRSGDFSTTYGALGLHVARIALDAQRYLAFRESIGARYQENFAENGVLAEAPGSMPGDQAKIYGVHRLQVEVQGSWHLFPEGVWAAIVSGSLSHERMWPTSMGVPDNRTIAEASYTLDQLHGAGVFVRYFTGQDDMNILFAEGRTEKVVFGFVWNTSPGLRYRFGEEE